MGIFGSRRTATSQEVAVAEAILRGSGDDRAEALLNQFRKARRVRRSIADSTLEVSVESTTEDLLADLDRNVASKAVQLRDVLSGQVLSFVVTLRRGGFFGSLCGTADGVWPRRWEIDPGEAARAAQGALVLEIGATADPSTLANALDVPAHVVRDVVLRPPADQADLAQVEQREQAPLPAALRDLLTISDGMLVHELAILGTQDTYLVDFGDGRPWWLVGQSRDGTHYVCGPEYVASIPEPRADPESMVRVATSYRDWVRDRLLKYA